MAKKRKFCAYRAIERPYTRFSKFKKYSYVKARPVCRIVRYNMGNPLKKFPISIKLVAKSSLQIRDKAMESARLTSNRLLEGTLGKNAYWLRLVVYPHHILRENPLAAGAGADRMSTGMKKSFGKTVGVAAQVKRGQTIITVDVSKQNLDIGKKAMKRASLKLPCSCSIVIVEKPAEKNAKSAVSVPAPKKVEQVS